ncbi:tRNA 2-selenouridine(34) synthase MnmH [Halioglobus japonicus]|uniref:tRNA 2-selenouridine synthase n=1 Tax=Halioglobus japonicus TaxID=930805 RepID=A0AAP8MD66_9GAMM|nr:tRNA 2-selenouridine(34) synthase MnmH [Halioglobus japonicus]AQA17448.1 tRNA 2-selenouridine(34) synthase MnmH [Halioglobus japonicus]PLW85372.1 tRNA 2-selenouridine(34) synthase MnmH [Halioglobus japonicus]GHD22063.1 tRNA 2-selenouridine synthase [Halioglobus japonicus]
MSQRPDTQDYRALFLADAPMMDMRAPQEFDKGAFPSAHSLPVMTDIERAKVGTCYKRDGQEAAIELGHRLVSGEVRAERLAAWREFAQAHPDGYLYCFRGGLRSQTVRQWLRDEGIDYPLVIGGYKAMRRFLIDELERSLATADIVLIGGKTGTGKTRVVWDLSDCIDLEGLANHRGSTFGQMPSPQPSQIDFENQLSIAFMKLLNRAGPRVYLEDEGRLIGRLYLPEILRDKMKHAPLVIVEQNLAERVDVVIDDYIVDLGERYRTLYGDDGHARHAQKLQDDLAKIRKRLGGERHQQMSAVMADAFAAQAASGDLQGHREWIGFLLEKYYDPMYEYQLEQREGEVLFSGSRDEVVCWCEGAR